MDADGVAVGCTDATTEIDSSIVTHDAISDAHHTPTADTNADTECAGAGVYLDGEATCTDATTEIDSVVATHTGVAAAHHTATTNTNAQTICASDEILDGDGDCITLSHGEFDTTHSPVGLWNFTSGALTDASGNGNDLKWVTGTDATANFVNEDGDDGIYCGGLGSLNGDTGGSFTEADFQITGALTVQAIVNVDEKEGATVIQAIVAMDGATGDAVAADNHLYNLSIHNNTTGNQAYNLRYFAESAGGANEAVQESNVYTPTNNRTHVAFVRDADGDVTFYVNGSTIGVSQFALLSPTGGTATEFSVCNNLAFAQPFYGSVYAVKVAAAELAAAQIAAEVALTMGF